MRAASLLVLVGLMRASVLAAQQSTAGADTDHPQDERIVGTVSDDSGRFVAGAVVIATRAPDRATFRATTDSAGRYEIRITLGTGDYLVFASAPESLRLRSARRRVGRAAPMADVLRADFVLPRASTNTLATVKVTAERPRVERDGLPESVGGDGAEVNLHDLVLSPDRRADFTAAGGRLPGAHAVDGGYSVLGVGGDQNATTLNGLAIPAAALPRDASLRASVATTTYDPSVGWFGGAQTSVLLEAGRTFSDRYGSATLDVPALQANSAGSEDLPGDFARLVAGLGGSGLTARDRLAYNFGIQASVRRADVASLSDGLEGRDPAMAAVSDSVPRLLAALEALGLPRSPAGIPDVPTSNATSFVLRLNTPERDPGSFEPLPRSLGLIVLGSRDESEAPLRMPLAMASVDARRTNAVASMQGVYSSLRGSTLLGELRSGVTVRQRTDRPYTSLPAGAVLLSGSVTDETLAPSDAFTSVRFGGTGSGASSERAITWESVAEAKFLLPGHDAHQVRITTDARLDAHTREAGPDVRGRFYYASLSDLESNRPALFSRTLDNSRTHAETWNVAVAVSDLWRASRSVRIMFGARLDANRYLTRPDRDPEIAALYGVHTDRVPDQRHLSPRIGFAWNTGWGAPGLGRAGYRRSALPSLGVVRGGFGEFRSLAGPELLNGALVSGSSRGSQALRCVGDAVPTPDWGAYLASPANIPQACLDSGAPESSFDVARRVQLIDNGYSPPSSWRANLAWGAALGQLAWSVEGVLSYNIHQPSTDDLNFVGASRFTLEDEGRPVFVPPGDIVPSTGLTSSIAARKSPAYDVVSAVGSEGRSIARQFSIAIAPSLTGDPPLNGRVTYTWATVRERSSGFDGSTIYTPTTVTWAPSAFDVRHSFDAQLAIRPRAGASLSLWARIASGTPFTPLVASDVNGDGRANDRAFIFDPAAPSTDARMGAAMRDLLARVPTRVRRCLTTQAGAAAGPGSCRGPWTAALDASLALVPPLRGERARRTIVTLYAQNVLGGLDALLHGRDRRGWGSGVAPDPVLLAVRGFDPVRERFIYEVNPAFGSARSRSGVTATPFRVTLDVRMTLGKPYPEQQVGRFLRPGRAGYPGPRLDAAALKQRYSRGVPNPFTRVLAESDSLLLQPDQVRLLLEAKSRFSERADVIWTGLARSLEAMPDDFDPRWALAQQESATDQVWSLARDEVQLVLPQALDRKQLDMLPYPASMLLVTRGKVVPQFRAF